MKFALAGNPNSGKTTLFNALTGSTAHVGNWPGVTVDKREGTYRKLQENVTIVDLPGIYSLSPYTPEEVVSRNFILDEKPECVINIVDATNLERNLYLTTQIMEIDVPVVIALNMIDQVKENGDKINIEDLRRVFGVPVVEVSALKEEGLDELMKAAYAESKKPRKGVTPTEGTFYYSAIETVCKALAKKGTESPLFRAVKLIEEDEETSKKYPEEAKLAKDLKKKLPKDDFEGDYEAIVADQRYVYICGKFKTTVTKKIKSGELTKSDKIDRVMTHRVWSIPIFLVIIFFVFHLVFSDDLLFLNSLSGGNIGLKSAGAINAFTGMAYEDVVTEAVEEAFDDEANAEEAWVIKISAIEDEDEQAAALEEVVADIVENGAEYAGVEVVVAIPGPGVFLQNWMGFATGSVIDGARYLFELGGEQVSGSWYAGLVCDGILTGLDAIFSFLPQILLLFLAIAILEDCGYMARVAFIMDRAFRGFGLSGRAFIPLLMGFGCSVPAMMATKTLEEESERDLTIRLAPYFSCGAKAPIWSMLAIVAAGVMGSVYGSIFVFTIYVLGIVMAIVVALFTKLFSPVQKVPPFIMELPAYHLPQARNLAAHLWEKLKHFVVKASTIITAAIIVVWFLQNFGVTAEGFGMVEDINESILATIGHAIQIFFTPLGWAQGEDGWRYTVAAFTGLIAKEDVIATLATLGLNEETMIGSLSGAALYSFAAYNLFTFPCFAAIGTAAGESSKKGFVLTLIQWFFGSYAIAAAIYWLGTLIEVNLAVGIAVLFAIVVAVIVVGLLVSIRRKKLLKL